MPGFLHIMRCVGRAVVKNGAGALASLVPFGNALFEIARDALEDYRKGPSNSEAALRAELEALAQASPTEVRKAAEEVASAEGKGLTDEIRLTLVATLGQMQDSTRKSLRRPADPSGKTVPAGLSLKTDTDLIPFLPPRPPRFKPGDRPIHNVDWELVKLLGVGGFGEVWRARNPFAPHLEAALKFCLDPGAQKLLKDPTSQQNLKHEAAVLAKVMSQGACPGIVQLRHTYLSADPR